MVGILNCAGPIPGRFDMVSLSKLCKLVGSDTALTVTPKGGKTPAVGTGKTPGVFSSTTKGGKSIPWLILGPSSDGALLRGFDKPKKDSRFFSLLLGMWSLPMEGVAGNPQDLRRAKSGVKRLETGDSDSSILSMVKEEGLEEVGTGGRRKVDLKRGQTRRSLP